jgi:hypothetical protein
MRVDKSPRHGIARGASALAALCSPTSGNSNTGMRRTPSCARNRSLPDSTSPHSRLSVGAVSPKVETLRPGIAMAITMGSSRFRISVVACAKIFEFAAE